MPLVDARPSYKAQRLGAQAQNHKFALYPAPVLGLDMSRPLTDQDPRSGLSLQNFIVRRSGSELRGGYRRWTTNLPGKVPSLMAYQPPRGATSTQLAKLWAGVDDGKIYDVTSQTSEATTPTSAVTIAGQNEPGNYSWVNFATAATNYLCVVSAGGGYYTYDHAGGWVSRTAAVTSTGGDNVNFDFVLAWKNRLWFLVENSAKAWFLPVGAITGAASPFDFGPLLIHGGDLRAMASWTLDAGDGVDDKLVIVSAQGDVLIYGGTDPTAAATFGLIGRWYVSLPPAGRRFMSKYGGDLAILGENGVEYMSRLVNAKGLLNPETMQDDTLARRYDEVIGQAVKDTRGQEGWSFVFVPTEQAAILTTPINTTPGASQFVFSSLPSAWSTFQGIPMQCAEVFNGELYFGITTGKIGQAFTADTDDELSTGAVGLDVVGQLQSAFVSPEDDRMRLKIPQLIMPMFQSSDPPSFSVQINTEWSSTNTSGSPPFGTNTNALWDVGTWDVAVWGGAFNTYLGWVGATGLGCYMSLRLSLIAKPRTLFTSWKLVYSPGGIM